VLCIENLQSSGDLVDFLGRATRIAEFANAPILCVCTVQDDELADDEDLADRLQDVLERTDGASREVGLLEEEDMRQLTAHMLRLSAEASERVNSYADGNPLFAIELVRDWVDRDLLEWTPAGFVLADTDEALVPEAAIDLWTTRLDAALEPLGDPERRAVQAAALIGLGIDQDVWFELCDRLRVDAPDRVVGHLLERRLVERTSGGWRFAHAMARHALLAEADRPSRLERLHAVCAETLQALWPENRWAIGQHWFRAKRFDRSLQPLLDAADRARREARHDRGVRCIELLERVLEELELPEDSRAALHVACLRALFEASLSRYEGVEEELLRYIEIAKRTPHRSEELALRCQLIGTYQLTGQFDAALTTANSVLSEDGLTPFQEYLAASCKAKILARTGSADEALSIIRQVKEQPWFESLRLTLRHEADALEARCMVRLNRLEEAVDLFDELADAQEALGTPLIAATSRLSRVNALIQLDRLDEAEVQCRAVLKEMQSFSVREVQNAELHLAYVLLYKGDLDDAEDLFKSQLGPIRRENRTYVETYLLCGLALIEAERRHWTRFEKRFNQMRTAADQTNNIDFDLARSMRMAADVAVEAGRTDLAIEALEFAISQLEALGLDDKLADAQSEMRRLRTQ
jgi:tetratricopeptide (TPR) repeat protein